MGLCFLTSPATEQEQEPLAQMHSTAPTVTNPSTGIPTDPVSTEPPVTGPPVTEPPVTEPLVTEPPVTEPPVTEPPATKPPATEPPATKPPATKPTVPQPSVSVIADGVDSQGRTTFRLTDDGTLTIYRTGGHSDRDQLAWAKHADSITKVVMKEGCTYIDEEAFEGFENLTEAYLCESLESIGTSAFRGCKSLRAIRIPANVTMIDSYAFAGCVGLSRVEFASDSKLTEIRSGAFSNTAISAFTAPPNLITVGYVAFSSCWRLETVILQGSVQVVGVDAFRNCTRLKHLVLGENVIQASRAFSECGEIETVENDSGIPLEELQ